MNKNKNIILIFPPFYLSTKVYPSIHYLKSYLSSQGYRDVSAINQTESFFEYLLDKSNFEKLLKGSTSNRFMEFFVKQFEKLDKQNSLNRDEAQKYLKLSKAIFESEYLNFFRNSYNTCETKEESAFFQYMVMFLKKNLSINTTHANIDETIQKTSVFFRDFFNSFTVPKIKKEKPVFIGISIIDSLQLIPTYILLSMLRDEGISARIFLGGPFFSKRYGYVIKDFHRDVFLKRLFSCIDGIVLFEGEIVLDKILRNLDNPDAFSHIPNLLLQRNDSVYLTDTANKERTFFKELPAPNFDDINFEKEYTQIPYLISRGCYWRKCSFCKSHSIYQNKFVSLKPERVIQDITYLKSRCESSIFYFCDEALPMQEMSKICQLIIESGLNITWSGNARFERQLLDFDFCRKLHMGGCRKLMFGLESGSQRILNFMNKGIKKNEAEIILKNLHNTGIKTHLYVIFGFPGETDVDAEETIEFVEKNKEVIDSAHPHTFILEKGTPIHKRYKDFGILKIEEESGGLTSGNECAFTEKTTRQHPTIFYSVRFLKIFKDKNASTININIEEKEVQEDYCKVTLNFNLDEIRQALESDTSGQCFKRDTQTYMYSPITKEAIKLAL